MVVNIVLTAEDQKEQCGESKTEQYVLFATNCSFTRRSHVDPYVEVGDATQLRLNGDMMNAQRSIIRKRDDDDVTLTRPLTKRVSFSVSNQTRLFTIDSDESTQSTSLEKDLSPMALVTPVVAPTTSSRSRFEAPSRSAGCKPATSMMDITVPSSAFEDDDWLQEDPFVCQHHQSTRATKIAESVPSPKHDNGAHEPDSLLNSKRSFEPAEHVVAITGSEKRTSVQQDEVTNAVELCIEETSAVREELLNVAENMLPSPGDNHLLDFHRIKATLHGRTHRRRERRVHTQPVQEYTLVDGTLRDVRFSNILPDITVKELSSLMGSSSAPNEMSQQSDTSTLSASSEVSSSDHGARVMDHNTLTNSVVDQGPYSGIHGDSSIEDNKSAGNNSERNMDSSECEDDSIQFSCGEIETINSDLGEESNGSDDTCCTRITSSHHQHETSKPRLALRDLIRRCEEDTAPTKATTTATITDRLQDGDSPDEEALGRRNDNGKTDSNQNFEDVKQTRSVHELDPPQQRQDDRNPASDDGYFDGPQEQVQNAALSQPEPNRRLDVRCGAQTLRAHPQLSSSALKDTDVKTSVENEDIPSRGSETFVKDQQPPPNRSTKISETTLQSTFGNNHSQAGRTMEISASMINKTYSVHEPREALHEDTQQKNDEHDVSNLDDELDPLNRECSQSSVESAISTQTPLKKNWKLQRELPVTEINLRRIPSPMSKEPFQMEFSDEELFKAYPDIFEGLGTPLSEELLETPPLHKTQIDFGMDSSELARKLQPGRNPNLQQSMSQQLDELRSVNRKYDKLLVRLNDFRARAEAEPLIDLVAVEEAASCIQVEADFVKNTATVTYTKHRIPLVEILCREGPNGSVVGQILSCLDTDASEGEGLDALAPLMVTWARHSLLPNPDAREWSAATKLEATAKVRATVKVLEEKWAYFSGIELCLHADDRMALKTRKERVYLRFAWRCREMKVFIDANLQEEIVVGGPLVNTCCDRDLKLDELNSLWRNNASLPLRKKIEMTHLKTLDLAAVDTMELFKGQNLITPEQVNNNDN